MTASGAVAAGGAARSFGDLSARHLNKPITGMAATADGGGYWLVASDGGVFDFGDARFYGSTGDVRLNKPITGMAATADGGGYWLVASDGGVFDFGDARFYGGTGGLRLAAPVVGIGPTLDSRGYFLATAGGSVYAFGDAHFAGSGGRSAEGVAATRGGGYSLLTAHGVQHFGPPVPPPATVVPPAQPASGLGGRPQQPTVPPEDATGRSSTIGTQTVPQVVRVGARLREVNPSRPAQYLAGTFRFAGVDAYEATTNWPDQTNGCGYSVPDAYKLALFQSLGRDAVVRTWFFQTLAMNIYNGTINWAPFDDVVQQADQAGVHLIATLGNQDGSCDDGTWKDPAWYAGGFRQRQPGHDYSYAQWVRMVVQRYAGNPAILAWEPMNEPRPDTCTDSSNCWNTRVCPSNIVANQSLRGFYDAIGTIIRNNDPNHLISDGAPPVAGCGTATWADMQNLESSPGVDLMSFHDYYGASLISSSDVTHWGAISAAVDKPLFAGENGGLDATDDAHPSSGCPTQSQRAALFGAKAANEFARMPFFTGWLMWNATPDNFTTCDYATWTGDPLLGSLAQVATSARS